VADYHKTRRGQWLDAGYEAFFERRTESVRFHKKGEGGIRLEGVTDDPDELRRRTQAAKRKIRSAGQGIPPSPTGPVEDDERTTMSKRYLRDPNVIAWVLIVANGRCEVCDITAPFVGMDGEPFLEVHHVRPLSEGGPDVTDNAVAACPNCHRRLHFSADRETL